MTVEDPEAEAIIAIGQENPALSREQIATRLGCSVAKVERTLATHGETDVDVPEPRDWSDPDRCPFCGAPLTDGGAGFMDHIDEAEGCAVAFERWREGIAGDIGGEWSG